MNRRLRLKLVVILAVVIGTSAFAWLPPLAERLGLPAPGFLTQKRLLLGLDLRGSVQFVLRVNADEALALTNARPPHARAILGATARLEWRLVHDAPPATEVVTGGDIRRAWVTRDDFGQPAVGFSLTREGARRFAELTLRSWPRPRSLLPV